MRIGAGSNEGSGVGELRIECRSEWRVVQVSVEARAVGIILHPWMLRSTVMATSSLKSVVFTTLQTGKIIGNGYQAWLESVNSLGNIDRKELRTVESDSTAPASRDSPRSFYLSVILPDLRYEYIS